MTTSSTDLFSTTARHDAAAHARAGVMQAVVQDRYGSADVLQLREIDRPRPGDRDVIVRVRAAGVDFGAWHFMTGMPYAMRLATGLRRPRNPVRGLELAGVVAEVGAKVNAFEVGDEVFGIGQRSFAEYARAAESKLVHKPRGLGFDEAAAVPVSATAALVGLRAGRVEAGRSVLITGAGGGVGSYAVQIASAMGAEVTGVCSTSKLDYVRALGAAHVIDYTREEITADGRTYDVIIDIAGSRAVSTLRQALAPRGTLVILGGEGGGSWLGMGRQIWAQLVGLTTRQRFRSPIALVNPKDLATLKGMLEAGTIRPAVDRRYPLSEVPTAMRALASGHARGKSVITIG